MHGSVSESLSLIVRVNRYNEIVNMLDGNTIKKYNNCMSTYLADNRVFHTEQPIDDRFLWNEFVDNVKKQVQDNYIMLRLIFGRRGDLCEK